MNDCIQLGGIVCVEILGTEPFMNEKPEHILVLCPEMALAPFPKKFIQNPEGICWKMFSIFCPEFTDRG